MIGDYRVYGTIYALCFVAWIGIFPLIHYAKNFKTVERTMTAVAGVATLTGTIHYLDWLWS